MPPTQKAHRTTSISLRNVGVDVRAKKTQGNNLAKPLHNKIRINKIPQGIEIPLQTRVEIPDEHGHAEVFCSRDVRTLFILLILSILPVGIIGGIYWLIGRTADLVAGLSVYVGLLLFTWLRVLFHLVKTETMVLSRGTMSIKKRFCGRTIHKRDYNIQQITNLRAGRRKGVLQFHYEGKMITCVTDFDREDRTLLLHQLSDMLKFHCYSVEHIIFGTTPHPADNPAMTCHNPDVSNLTLPFFHLKHVVIYTDTYDFHQVERFLTYAVNYIGQDYLKNYMDVEVYGELEKLHSNLYNSLTNLCKRVSVRKENDILTTI